VTIPRQPAVDLERLAQAWDFARRHGEAGPPDLREAVARTGYSHLARFLERREPLWALRNQLPKGRLLREPPKRGGHDEYGLDASGAILTVRRHQTDGMHTQAWVTAPAPEATVAYFDAGRRLAAVGVYSSDGARLISTQWRVEYAPTGEQFVDERYFYDANGRLERIETASTPDPVVNLESERYSYWADYHLRYTDDGTLLAVGQFSGTGQWGSLYGTFDPNE
jgi:hypothetical protein